MYSHKHNLIIGFHGCDKSVQEKVINNREPLYKSENDYDWLGHGIYFWENNFSRAIDFAREFKGFSRKDKATIKSPAVIGAVIDLGYCLDLLDNYNLNLLQHAYNTLKENHDKQGLDIPKNRVVKGSDDLLLRDLDCAVIQMAHSMNDTMGGNPFDSVRGVFFEGKELYPNSGFREKNHIQICIRNPNCIKGYFIPREEDRGYPVP